MSDFDDFPAMAAWRHRGAREGFEVVFFQRLDGGGHRITGSTSAVEAGVGWVVGYTIEVDENGVTRTARLAGRTARGHEQTTLRHDGAGRWQVDDVAVPEVDGCLDVDLESSAMTNALPVRRMMLAQGEHAAAPAAYVRAENLVVERLEQSYARIPDPGAGRRFDYDAPAFDTSCQLLYDGSGLVTDYPGIAVRIA